MQVKIEHSPLAKAAMQAALKAGAILRKGFGTQFSTTAKESFHDIVTEFDRSAEEAMISYLRQCFPKHAFLAEESGRSEDPDAEVCWIIDPLDGTLNFARHLPMFCVSIAAVVNRKIDTGVIYNPLLNEMFVAERDHGAYLCYPQPKIESSINSKRLSVSRIDTMEKAVIATGFPVSSSETRDLCIAQFIKFLDNANPIRLLGSAALTLAYIAAGRLDVYWGSNLKPWDVAAGNLLIEEAGGKVTNFDGSAHDLFQITNTLATNALLHDHALSILK